MNIWDHKVANFQNEMYARNQRAILFGSQLSIWEVEENEKESFTWKQVLWET